LDIPAFVKDYNISDNTLSMLIDLGKVNGVKYDEKEFERSKALIKIYLKAYIARSVWGNNGFFPVINQQNEILTRALQLKGEAISLIH
jgi:carboxyl-terminal processing protease